MRCPFCSRETDRVLTTKLRRGEERKVYYCEPCDLGFLENMKAENELKAYYQEEYRKEYKPDLIKDTNPRELFDSYVNFQAERLHHIAPYLNESKTLLEVGCSAGQFLCHVTARVGEAVGIELDQTAADFAAARCGCKVYSDYLGNTDLPQNYFDIICAFQTLEHVANPSEFIMALKAYLKDDGVLYLEVPNLGDALVSTYDLPRHRQFYYHAAHTYYFSKRSLEIILRKTGFDGDFFYSQDYNLLNHFQWLINDAPQSGCMAGLARPTFNFRDDVAENVKHDLNAFLGRIDTEYKNLLIQWCIASNIGFIGKKSPSPR